MACFTVFISHTNPFPKYILDDGDMKIDEKEVPFLALRLQIQLEQYGIKLDTAKFDAMIKEDNGEEIAAPHLMPNLKAILFLIQSRSNFCQYSQKRHQPRDEVVR